MTYLTNSFGWEFFVDSEAMLGRWTGVVRIAADGDFTTGIVRCMRQHSNEADALSDAQQLACDWAERLERSPQSARRSAEAELASEMDAAERLCGSFTSLEIGAHYA